VGPKGRSRRVPHRALRLPHSSEPWPFMATPRVRCATLRANGESRSSAPKSGYRMFFRNLTLFRFSPAVATDLDRLDEALGEHRLRPCGPLEMFTRGFVPPVGRGEGEPLTHALKRCTLMTVGGEDKLLPAAVINDELQRKVQKIAEEEGRKIGGRERKRLKEDLLTELLPRAFVRQSRMSAYVDKQHGWLVLDTSSRKSAENALSQVREALGSFPAVPLAPEEGPRVLMTDWLANGNLPAGL